MKRRILAFVCMLSILLGMFAMPSAAASAEDSYYQVGYSKKDVNPWVDPKDPSKGIIKVGDDTKGIPLSGYGNAEERIATDMLDDNLDGIVGVGDGLFTTCTVVVDPDGSMVFFFTLDALSGYSDVTSKVKENVVKEIAALGGTVTADQIMVTGSHSHTSADMNSLNNNAEDTKRVAYFNYIVSQMTDAAVEAYEDSKGTRATMKRRQLNVFEDYGYQMNWVRHINVPLIVQEEYVYKSHIFGKYGDDHTDTVQGETGNVVYGSNFGYASYTKNLATEDIPGSSWLQPDVIGTKTTKLVSDGTNRQHVADPNQNMYLLTFEFEDDRDPVVMVNWRAHPDNIGNNGDYKYISSDYVGALRYRLEENKTQFGGDRNYRVGFWQGASGNINTHSAIDSHEPWVDETQKPVGYDKTTDTGFQKSTCPYRKYGYMLGEAALLNLENNIGSTVVCDVGSIATYMIPKYRTMQYKYSAEEIQAAKDFATEYNVTTLSQVNASVPSSAFPYKGVINSKYHWNKVYAQSKKSYVADTYTTGIGALMIGSDAAFVVSTCELFDRYSEDQSIVDNDWLTLLGDAYGMPFVLGYTNDYGGYIPNTMAYHYNDGEEYKGYNLVGAGSYEANTTPYAEGTGEALIKTYKRMLSVLNNPSIIHQSCPNCQKTVDWIGLTSLDASTETLNPGHYYLTEDIPMEYSVQKSIGTNGNKTVCLDLNGYTLSAPGRCFYLSSGVTLNVFNMINNIEEKNSGTTGKMIGHTASNNPGGGAFYVGGGCKLNLYGGTLEFQKQDGVLNSSGNPAYGVGYAGTVLVGGTMNIYGGIVQGGELVHSTYDSGAAPYNGCGGAIAISGVVNVYSGAVRSGSVPEGGFGPCIYLASTTGKIKLYGDAVVDDIYYRYKSDQSLTVSGTYTGTANLTFHDGIALSNGVVVGSAVENADISDAIITCSDTNADWGFLVENGKLLLCGYSNDTVAIIGSTEYSSLQDAVDAYNGSKIITMIQDETEPVAITKQDVYLDLNGHSISGQVTTSGNYTLYCKDTLTDDYTVQDDKYGRMTNIAAGSNVEGIPEASTMADDGYLKITETDGTSFHRVNLDLTHMTLRAVLSDGTCAPSVYYKSNFAGDEKVAAAVDYYGVAVSVQVIPDASNIESSACKFSKVSATFQSGKDANSANGTLLKGIMKEQNSPINNNKNANMPINGRAYIHTSDGYMMGEYAERTLKQQTEEADAEWIDLEDPQKESMITMYEKYSDILKKWSLPNLFGAVEYK